MNQFELNKILRFGLTAEQVSQYDILCLPENLEDAANIEELFDASDSIVLAKFLKAAGLNCANSFDLSLEPKILQRRSAEKWYGVVFLRNNVAIPLFVTVLGGLIGQLISNVSSADEPAPKIHIELKIEKPNTITTIKYDGDPQTLLSVLKQISSDSAAKK